MLKRCPSSRGSQCRDPREYRVPRGIHTREPRDPRYSRPVSTGKARVPQIVTLVTVLAQKY